MKTDFGKVFADGEYKRQELLESVRARMGCSFLSDLRMVCADELYRAVSDIPAQLYTPKEWNDASVYLTGRGDCFCDSGQARRGLLEQLKQWP